jgi:hypothetical protein
MTYEHTGVIANGYVLELCIHHELSTLKNLLQ